MKEIVDNDGNKTSNPTFEEWDAMDQQVFGYLLSWLGREILTQVASTETAAEAWSNIEAIFMSQTRARAVNLRLTLSTTKKGNLTVTKYF